MNFQKNLLTLVVLALLKLPTHAQVPIMPDQFRINIPNQKTGSETPISWFELEYKSPSIDLRGLQELTSYQIPDSVLITPPDISTFLHMVTLVGITGDFKDPTLIVWLAGNYRANRFTLFTDQDQDRDFNNDRKPIRIRRGGEVVHIRITTNQGDQFLDLLPPPRNQETRITRPIGNGLSLSFSGGLGVGSISYDYQDLSFNQPTKYSVRLVEKGLKVTAAYEWNNIQFGASAAFQNHFFYTSTLEIKKGDPIRLEVPDPNLPGRTTFITIENVEKLTNKDTHSPNRLQTSLYGSYLFRFGSNFVLQPIVSAGIVTHFDPQYTRIADEEGETYDLKRYSFYEAGIRMEFTTGLSKAMYLEFMYATEQWQPENFLSGIPHESLESGFSVLRFNIGYRFSMF